MKKIVYLIIPFFLLSCSSDDDNKSITNVNMPIYEGVWKQKSLTETNTFTNVVINKHNECTAKTTFVFTGASSGTVSMNVYYGDTLQDCDLTSGNYNYYVENGNLVVDYNDFEETYFAEFSNDGKTLKLKNQENELLHTITLQKQ